MQRNRIFLVFLIAGLLWGCNEKKRNDKSSELACPPQPKVNECDLKTLAEKNGVNIKKIGFEPKDLIYRYAARLNRLENERAKADYKRTNPRCPVNAAKPVKTGPCPDIEGFSDDQLLALKTAQIIHKNVPNWWNVVPGCPCDEKDVPDFWSGEPAKQAYHPGATHCHRSLPLSKKDLKAAGLDPQKISPGQQCCYDKHKKLITEGSAAGTPDLYVPIDQQSNAAHWNVDVELFHKLGFKIYNVYWPPDNRNQCSRNKIP